MRKPEATIYFNIRRRLPMGTQPSSLPATLEVLKDRSDFEQLREMYDELEPVKKKRMDEETTPQLLKKIEEEGHVLRSVYGEPDEKQYIQDHLAGALKQSFGLQKWGERRLAEAKRNEENSQGKGL
jgi:hypothetical protein